MVDAKRGDAQRRGQPVGERGANQQRPSQARAFGVANGAQLAEILAGRRENASSKRGQAADVIAGGEFGYHPPVGLVHRHLRMQGVREQAAGVAVVQRDASLVARGLDAEDQHRSILIQFDPFSTLQRHKRVRELCRQYA